MSKVFVITGASSGVGKALAVRFASEGNTICALARSRDKPESLAGQYPDTVDIYPTDVSDANQVKHSFTAILEKHGAVDVLINNAGVHKTCNFDREDIESIDRIIDVNLKGTIRNPLNHPSYQVCSVDTDRP